jgi:hypothetical protein
MELDDRNSNLLLFATLLMVCLQRSSLGEALRVTPLNSRVRRLADHLMEGGEPPLRGDCCRSY